MQDTLTLAFKLLRVFSWADLWQSVRHVLYKLTCYAKDYFFQ